jgi:hypothetical protein
MIQRKTFAVDEGCEIALTTEQLADGAWAVVASIKHHREQSERIVDLPVPAARFASEQEAEAFGLRMAREWIERNLPRAA